MTEEREKEEKKKEDNLLNNCKFLKVMLPKLVIAKFGAIYFDCVQNFRIRIGRTKNFSNRYRS